MRPLIGQLVTICLVSLAGCGQAPQPAPTLDDILASNAEARGGKALFESLQAMRLEVHIEEPTFEVTGTYVATREGLMRVDIYAGPQRAFSEALGPDGGWQWRGGEPQTEALSDQGNAALMRGVVSNLYALYQWPGQGYRLELATADPTSNYWQVEATHTDGFRQRFWIDRESHLVVREMEHSALHPDVDSVETDQYSKTLDWLVENGMRLPRTIEKIDAATGEVIQRSTVLSAELAFEGSDPPEWLDEAHFRAPVFNQLDPSAQPAD